MTWMVVSHTQGHVSGRMTCARLGCIQHCWQGRATTQRLCTCVSPGFTCLAGCSAALKASLCTCDFHVVAA